MIRAQSHARCAVTLLVVASIGCQQAQSPHVKPTVESSASSADANNKSTGAPLRVLANEPSRLPQQSLELELLKELDSFRSLPSFARYGFGRGGPHYQWLERVQQARKRTDLSLASGVALGELQMLGLKYVWSKGAETTDTRWFRKRVMDPLGND